jgi:hypothetical protein
MGLKKLRQKRYRRYLFSEEELRSGAAALQDKIAVLGTAFTQRTLPEPEIAARYILEFLKVFRARDYRGGPLSLPPLAATVRATMPAVREFAERSLRSVPLAVNRSIVAWAEGRYPLVLTAAIPSAEELLRLQAGGQRVVTCLFQPEQLTRWVHGRPHAGASGGPHAGASGGPHAGASGGRDPLGFVLHDLIHAEHFFRDRELYAGQVEFYREVLERLTVSREFSAILASPEAREKFEYIISDMNSHPEHLRGCLAQLERTTV